MNGITALCVPDCYFDRSAVHACFSSLQAGWSGVLIGRIKRVVKAPIETRVAIVKLTDGVGNEMTASVHTRPQERTIEGLSVAYAGRVDQEHGELVFSCAPLGRRYVGTVEPRYPYSAHVDRYFSQLSEQQWNTEKDLAIHHIHFWLGDDLPELLKIPAGRVDELVGTTLRELHYPNSIADGRDAKQVINTILKEIRRKKTQLNQLISIDASKLSWDMQNQ